MSQRILKIGQLRLAFLLSFFNFSLKFHRQSGQHLPTTRKIGQKILPSSTIFTHKCFFGKSIMFIKKAESFVQVVSRTWLLRAEAEHPNRQGHRGVI